MVKNIIFDFDGVILDSVSLKTEAFRRLFEAFDATDVNTFIAYHQENGGVSRYAKIRYFFETILKRSIDEVEVARYANRYSTLTKEALSQPTYLIKDCVEFIHKHYQSFRMHIASGADEEDLHYICNHLGLTRYFVSIHGSPTPKNQLVKALLLTNAYVQEETILIGDSINDYDAAKENHITFYGYNNTLLRPLGRYLTAIGDSVLPVISVITVTYNARQFLEQTMQSVIEQDYANIEYIVIDGASTDRTLEIIHKYESRLAYWVSEPDEGIYDAMNKGVLKATGEWILFMNAGDTFVSTNTVATCVKAFQSNCAMVYGGINVVNTQNQSVVYQPPLDLSMYVKRMPCCHQAVFFKTALVKHYQFNTLFKINADLDLILKLYHAGHSYVKLEIPVINFLSGGIHTQDFPRGDLDEIYVTSRYMPTCRFIYEHEAYHRLRDAQPDASSHMCVSIALGKMILQLETLKSKYSKIAVYGYGGTGKLIASFLGDHLSGVFDLNAASIRQTFVCDPLCYRALEHEIIIVSLLGREDEIRHYLIEHVGVEEKTIYTFDL